MLFDLLFYNLTLENSSSHSRATCKVLLTTFGLVWVKFAPIPTTDGSKGTIYQVTLLQSYMYINCHLIWIIYMLLVSDLALPTM